MSRRRDARPLAAILLAACGAEPAPSAPRLAPGLEAEPPWLVFTCLEAGCETTRTATVSVRGDRALALRRLEVSGAPSGAYAVSVDPPLPAVLEPGDRARLGVRHQPSGIPSEAEPRLLLTYTDASPFEDPERAAPARLAIPLVERRVGQARLMVSPEALSFGAVAVGADATRTLRLGNVGFGNVSLALEELSAEPMADLELGPLPALLSSGETFDLRVRWRPRREQLLQGSLRIRPGGGAESTVVSVSGTSFPDPRLRASPAGGVDFGQLRVGDAASATVELTNEGGRLVSVAAPRLLDVPPEVEIALGGDLQDGERLAPLGRAALSITLRAEAPVALDARLRLAADDPRGEALELPLRALVARPRLEIAPRAARFGAVVTGWTRTQTVRLYSRGVGPLRIFSARLLLGSSSAFSLGAPALPADVPAGASLPVRLDFRAAAEAELEATLVVESSDPARPVQQVAVSARGVSCEEGCPTPNGRPSCLDGACVVEACNPSFYDVDGVARNGCECREPEADPGRFCPAARDLGRLPDDGRRVAAVGIVPELGDQDLFRFHAQDEAQLFADAYDVRVQLETADPDLEMCVYRHPTGTPRPECVFENETCGRRFRRDGTLVSDDAADYLVRVRRRPGAAPTCTAYILRVRNG